MSDPGQRLWRFLTPRRSDNWLGILRIGMGASVLLYSLSLYRDWLPLYRSNGNGIISRDLSEALLSAQSPFIPRLGWLVQIGGAIHLSEEVVLKAVLLLLMCSSCFLLAGLLSRSAALTAWFIHLCAVKSGNLIGYGVDNFTTIGLFYLLLSPLPDHLAVDSLLRRTARQNDRLLGLFQRILQVHVCIIYFYGGLAKAVGKGWWDGTTLWQSVTSPPYDVISPHVWASLAPILPALGIGVWALELGYSIFIWWEKTRFIWFLAILTMHIAIAYTMGLYLFSLAMIVLNLAAFGPDIFPWLNRGSPAESVRAAEIPNSSGGTRVPA